MTFVRGDAMELPFLDNSFDIVLSRLAFHHFSHSEQRLPRTEAEWKVCTDLFGCGRRIASEHGGRNRAPAPSFAYAKSQPSGNVGTFIRRMIYLLNAVKRSSPQCCKNGWVIPKRRRRYRWILCGRWSGRLRVEKKPTLPLITETERFSSTTDGP